MIYHTYSFWNYIIDEHPLLIEKIKEILTHKSYNFDKKVYEYAYFYQIESEIEIEGQRYISLRYPAGLTNYLRKKVSLKIEYAENPYPKYTEKDVLEIANEVSKVNPQFEVREYQIDAVLASLDKFSSLIKSSTGSGKTSILSLLCKILSQDKILIMNGNNFILQQIYERLLSFGETDIGWNPSKTPDYTKRIVLINTKLSDSKLNKQDIEYIKFLSEINTLIVDEVHRMQALTGFEPIFYTNPEKLKHIVGYSASPFRNYTNPFATQEDFRLIALLGEPAFEYDMKDTMEDGNIATPYAYFIRYPNKPAFVPAQFADNYFMQYRANIIYNKARNKAGIEMLKFLNKNGIKTIASFNNIKPGQAIMKSLKEAGVPALFICGDETIYEWKETKRGKLKLEKRDGTPKDLKKALNKDGYNIVIASQVLDEGVDIDIFQCAVLFSANKSTIGILQRIGRASRKRKTGENSSLVVDFRDIDGYYIFQKHYEERKRLFQHSGIKIFEDVQDFIQFVEKLGKDNM